MPPRVLHIVENLDRGAVENWLVRMLAHGHSRGTNLDWTFYCTLPCKGAMEEFALSVGAHVIHSPVLLDNQIAFACALRHELVRGRYDVLHCHHDLVSGLYLASAIGLPIKRRLVHVHNADEAVLTPIAFKRRIYRPLLRHIGIALADQAVGISDHTLDTYLAGRPRRPGRDIVHYYGIDTKPFEGQPPNRELFRRELSVPPDALILLFGGRLVPEKNPVFAVDVLAELRRLQPRVIGIFVGSGSLETAVMDRAASLGVAESIRMLGWRIDLPAIMRCADWFILPRPEKPMEGFGLAVVEAQLAGLRLLVSRGIPQDALLPNAKVSRIPLNAPAHEWATEAIALLAQPAPSIVATHAALAASPMNMDRALGGLISLHQT